jgi:hypothetical protein
MDAEEGNLENEWFDRPTTSNSAAGLHVNHLAQFHILDITKPLTLSEQEALAHRLVQQIVQEEKNKKIQLSLPKHLDDVRKIVDPAGKVQSKLPIFSQLSPRTRRKLMVLPKPNEFELQQIRQLDRQSKEIGGKTAYAQLHDPRQFAELEQEIFSQEIADPKPHLIPNVIDSRSVDKTTTKYFEDAEKYKRRKADQAKQLERLFGEKKSPVQQRMQHVSEDDQQSVRSESVHSRSVSSRSLNNSAGGLLSPSRLVRPATSEEGTMDTGSSEIGQSTATGISFAEAAAAMMFRATSPTVTSAPSIENHGKSSIKSSKNSFKPISSGIKKFLPPLKPDENAGFVPMNSSASFSSFLKPPSSSTARPSSSVPHAGYTALRTAPAPYESQSLKATDEMRVPSRTALSSSSTVTSSAIPKSVQREREFLNDFSARVKDEMGIDLNAQYNRLRHFRHWLQILLLHFLHCRQRAGFQQWWAVTRMLRKRRMRLAASRIYKALRTGISWRRKRELEHYEMLQREDEHRRFVENQLFIAKKAKCITRAIRRYVKRKRLWYLMGLRRAATEIQRHCRGRLGRKRYQYVLQAHRRIYSAALMIQCMVRVRLSRRRVKLLRKLCFVEHWLQTLARKSEQYRHAFYRNGAVSYISRAYRHYLITRRLHRLVYWNHVAKAIVLQRVYRGYRMRKTYRVRVSLYRDVQRQQERAAVVIQSCVRRFLAECQADALFAAREAHKQQRYQAKLWKLAQGVSWRRRYAVWMRSWSLKTRIYKMLYLHSKAMEIQRIWRGHHGRVRMWYVRVHRRLHYWHVYFQRRHRAATRIQARIRGLLARCRHRHQRLLDNVLRVQCAFRMFRARNRLRQRKYIDLQARKMTRMFRRMLQRHRFHVKYQRQQLLAQKIGVLQCFVRRYLARRHVHATRTHLRRDVEFLASTRSHIIHLLAGIQCRLLHETMTKPIQQRPYVVSRQDCLCFGPLQAIFVLGFCHGNRLRTEAKFLPTHRVDSASMVKYLMKVEGLVQMTKLQQQALGFGGGGRHVASPNGIYHAHDDGDVEHHLYRQRLFLSPEALKRPLLTLLLSGDLPLPNMRTTLSTTDIDLIFKKAKAEDNVTHKLGYMEFVHALELLAQVHYHERDKRSHKRRDSTAASLSDDGDGQSLLSRDEDDASVGSRSKEPGDVDVDGIAADDDDKDKDEVGVVGDQDGAQIGQNLHELLTEQIREVHHGQYSFLRRDNLTLDPRSLLAAETDDAMNYRFALVVRLLYVFQHESYVQEVLSWLAQESTARLGLFVVRIQCLIRRRLARLRVRRVRRDRAEARRHAAMLAELARVQALVRSFVYRRRVMKLAQRIIVKYHPYLSDAYYYNPRTQVKTYTKPRVLGHLDAFTIALPEEGLAFFVHCYNCVTNPATCFCQDCEDSLCRLCFDSLHCKGQRRGHRAQSIPLCAYCHGHQMATKSCVTCVVSHPRSDSYRATIQPVHRRAYFCDTCFVHEHDAHFYRQLEDVPSTRRAYQTLLHHSRQATLVAQTLHQRIRTRHVFTHLVQVCEECQQFASAWRCFDCEQVYCGRCLVVYHQLNPTFVTHAIEQLPYYTPEMHQSYHRDVQRKRFTYKWERLLLRERRRTQEVTYHAAVRIQAWYRMHFYRRVGRRTMQRRRWRLRSMFRLRRREDALYRSQRWYQVRDFFGRAPMLTSDSTEERVLKRMWLWSRESARRYILQNYDEWAYYRLRHRHPPSTAHPQHAPQHPFQPQHDKHGKKQQPQQPQPSPQQLQSPSQAVVPSLHVHATRKGVPKRGFDVGDVDDLIEQAMYGGYRLPGRVTVRENDQYAETQYNLMPYLRRGEIVRIHRRYFGVIAVEATRVKLSRKWYISAPARRRRGRGDGYGDDDDDDEQRGQGEDEEAEIDALADKLHRAKERASEHRKRKQAADDDDDNNHNNHNNNNNRKQTKKKKGVEEDGAGSIISMDTATSRAWSQRMYRVPTYKDEKGQAYYKLQYVAYEYTINNPVYQIYLRLHRMYAQRMIRLSLRFYQSNQHARNPQEALEWKRAAMKYAQQMRDATARLATEDAFVDLSNLSSPFLHGEEEDPINNPMLKPLFLEDHQAWIALQAPDRKRRSVRRPGEDGRGHEGDDDDDEGDGSDDDDDNDDDSDDPLHSHLRKKPDAGSLLGQAGHGKVLASSASDSPTASRRPRIRNSGSPTKESGEGGFGHRGDGDDDDDDEDDFHATRIKKARGRKDGEDSDDDELGFEGKDDDDDNDGEDGDMADARVDYDSEYIDPETGQKTVSAAEIKRREREERMKAKQDAKRSKGSRKSKKSSKKINKPKKAWFATKEQEEERKLREDKMTVVELAMEAVEWKEEIDVMTENIYFININTNEMMTTVPRAVQAKRQLEFENSRKKRDFDVAQRRIHRLELETRNRLLITGGRKK